MDDGSNPVAWVGSRFPSPQFIFSDLGTRWFSQNSRVRFRSRATGAEAFL